MPKGKQFDFNEMSIFGKFDLFCRRVIKLIDMFSTIDQFKSLSVNKLEGMEQLIARFHQIVKEFRGKGHDLLDYHNNKFDRDYVEFNVEDPGVLMKGEKLPCDSCLPDEVVGGLFFEFELLRPRRGRRGVGETS